MSSRFTCPPCTPCEQVEHNCSQNYVENLPQNFTCIFDDALKSKNQDAIRAVEVYCVDIGPLDIGTLSAGPSYVNKINYNQYHNMFDTRYLFYDTGARAQNLLFSSILSKSINVHVRNLIYHPVSGPYNAREIFTVLFSTNVIRSSLNSLITSYLSTINKGNISSSKLREKFELSIRNLLLTNKLTDKTSEVIGRIATYNKYNYPTDRMYGSSLALELADKKRISLYPRSTNDTYSQREKQLLRLIPSDINLHVKVHKHNGTIARVKIQDDDTIEVIRLFEPPIMYSTYKILSVNTRNEFLRVFTYYSDCRGKYMKTMPNCCFDGCYVALCSDRNYSYALNAEDRTQVFRAFNGFVSEPKMEIEVECSAINYGALQEFNYDLTTPLKEWYLLIPDLCGIKTLQSSSIDNGNLRKTNLKYIKTVDAGTNPANYNTIDPYIKRGGFGDIVYINNNDPFWGHFSSVSSVSVNLYDIGLSGVRPVSSGIYPRRVPYHIMLVPCNSIDMDPLRGESMLTNLEYTKSKRVLTAIPNPQSNILDDTYIASVKHTIPGYVQGTDMFPIIKKTGIYPGYFTSKAFDGGVIPATIEEHIIRKVFRLFFNIAANYNISDLNYKIAKADLWKVLTQREFIEFMLKFRASLYESVFVGGLFNTGVFDVSANATVTSVIDPLRLIQGGTPVTKIMDTIPLVQ